MQHKNNKIFLSAFFPRFLDFLEGANYSNIVNQISTKLKKIINTKIKKLVFDNKTIPLFLDFK